MSQKIGFEQASVVTETVRHCDDDDDDGDDGDDGDDCRFVKRITQDASTALRSDRSVVRDTP